MPETTITLLLTYLENGGGLYGYQLFHPGGQFKGSFK
jgi:hypothetical protein